MRFDPSYSTLVSTVSVLSILSAALFRQWVALSGLIVLLPLTGRFLVFDSRLLRRWRGGMLEMARLRGLDMAVFRKTISGFRYLPPNALKAMLATLPASHEDIREQVPRAEPAVVDEFEALERKNARRILIGTGLLTLTLICLIGGAYFGSVTLLLLGAGLVTLVIAFGRR